MMEQIFRKKYLQAMQQLHNMTDIAFHRTAELEIASARIVELETQLKEQEDGKQSDAVQD